MFQRLRNLSELRVIFGELVRAKIGVLVKVGLSVRQIALLQVLNVAVASSTEIRLGRLMLVSFEHDKEVPRQALVRL